MMQTEISEASQNRFKRIMELRNCNEQEALEYCISVGWYLCELKKDNQARGKSKN